MIRSFEICFDFFECEWGWLELSAGIQRRLVEVVFALRIAAGAEGVD
jgi:hypothetical protein